MNYMKNLSKAVKTLSKALRNDPDLFYGYQANIAMQFKDEYSKMRKKKKYLNSKDIHEISNVAAASFLNLLIRK